MLFPAVARWVMREALGGQVRKSAWRKAHYLALLPVSHIPVLDDVASTDQRLATSVSTMLAFPLGGDS